MITEKHDNCVYVKRGDSIAEYSQKTYDEIIKAGKGMFFKDTRDIATLFVPDNTSVVCKSGDVSNPYGTHENVVFEIRHVGNNMKIKSGYKTLKVEKERAYMLKASPKSILSDSGLITIDGKNTLAGYGRKTSLPVVVISNDDGISITHELGKELYVEAMLPSCMMRTITF